LALGKEELSETRKGGEQGQIPTVGHTENPG